jgi:hypothetical protein
MTMSLSWLFLWKVGSGNHLECMCDVQLKQCQRQHLWRDLLSWSEPLTKCSSREKDRDSTAWRADDVLHAFLKAVFSNRRSLLVQISAPAQNTAHECAHESNSGAD